MYTKMTRSELHSPSGDLKLAAHDRTGGGSREESQKQRRLQMADNFALLETEDRALSRACTYTKEEPDEEV